MFDEIKKILAEEFSIDEEKITPEAEFVNDLGINYYPGVFSYRFFYI